MATPAQSNEYFVTYGTGLGLEPGVNTVHSALRQSDAQSQSLVGTSLAAGNVVVQDQQEQLDLAHSAEMLAQGL